MTNNGSPWDEVAKITLIIICNQMFIESKILGD